MPQDTTVTAMAVHEAAIESMVAGREARIGAAEHVDDLDDCTGDGLVHHLDDFAADVNMSRSAHSCLFKPVSAAVQPLQRAGQDLPRPSPTVRTLHFGRSLELVPSTSELWGSSYIRSRRPFVCVLCFRALRGNTCFAVVQT
jgi:hypothetical protein